MAKRVFCDGCDDEIFRPKGTNEAKVGIQQCGGSVIDQTFDVCDKCNRRLLELADPRKWVRHRGSKAA